MWPKQTALIVAGLRKQLDRAFEEEWPFAERNIIRIALVETAKASLRAFNELDGVPELYINADKHASRYDTQTIRDGQVNYIQLWSAVGFRRILTDYIYAMLKYDLPMEFLD